MTMPLTQPELLKFAMGQPVSRKEDATLLQGKGRYTTDISLPGQAYAVFVRSQIAHGRILSIDTSAARDMPGVIAIFTLKDLTDAGIGPMPEILFDVIGNNVIPGLEFDSSPHTPLAGDKVRFVGDAYALVVAETRNQAVDAAEAVYADIEQLPAIVTMQDAAAPGAALVHDAAEGNVCVTFNAGNKDAVDAAMAEAAHVVKVKNVQARMAINPMEVRAAVGDYDPENPDRFIIHVGCQGVFWLRTHLAKAMRVPREQVRVHSGNTGGSFGLRAFAFPEYPVMMFAARALKRPVKWVNTRSESFLTDNHAKEMEYDAELALDKAGNFLAVRVRGGGNIGAYAAPATVVPPCMNINKNIVSVYKTPAVRIETKAWYTNTVALGPYRGAGRPEANSIMEQLIEAAADATGIDSIELRRINHITPEQMPYRTPTGNLYDSGDFTAVLNHALDSADWQGFADRRRESRNRGKLRGIGIGQFLECTAPPSKEMAGIRFDDDGGVTIVTGTHDHGQGHHSTFAQVLVTNLGVPFEKIRIFQGDSDQLVAGDGTGGSKSLMASGMAIMHASTTIIEKGTKLAAHFLEAAVADIEFGNGRFAIAGTDRGLDVLDLAARLRAAPALPEGLPTTLDTTHVTGAETQAFPNGAHVCELEIDPETGVVALQRYTMVDDFGNIINPKIVHGQVHGGASQGIGQVLLEHMQYDEHGQLITGSLMDYNLPRALDFCSFASESHPVPARTNLLGAKGCGEAGAAGAVSATINAVRDALRQAGVTETFQMPATPHRVWQALQAVR